MSKVTEIELGNGLFTVDAGLYGGRPGVFIEAADPTGTAGELVPPKHQGDLTSVKSGSVVLTFLTGDHAIAVANAMCGVVHTAIARIQNERARQLDAEGHTVEHDDGYTGGELAMAAASYCCAEDCREMCLDKDALPATLWPWGDKHWKPSPDDRIKELVKAGALIVAEIERLQRLAPTLERVELEGVGDSDGFFELLAEP